MGEHISENEFRILDITIQKMYGGFAFFKRIVYDLVEPMKNYFRQTGHNYKQFNYLGEWHSHPSFSLYPSTTDHLTMKELIEDARVGANFVILIIVKLNTLNELEGTVTVYENGKAPYLGILDFC
jgi:proteasome lid subunit RPN8/RPN11